MRTTKTMTMRMTHDGNDDDGENATTKNDDDDDDEEDDDGDDDEEDEGSMDGARSVTLHSPSLPGRTCKKPPRIGKYLERKNGEKLNTRQIEASSKPPNYISGLFCSGHSILRTGCSGLKILQLHRIPFVLFLSLDAYKYKYKYKYKMVR